MSYELSGLVRRCDPCHAGLHPTCKEQHCGCECWSLRNRNKMLPLMQTEGYFRPDEWRRMCNSGRGFRPMQQWRESQKPLRRMELCWRCNRVTVSFVSNRNNVMELRESVCPLHLNVAQARFANKNIWPYPIEWYVRYNFATKNNPYGYKYAGTTPIEYAEQKKHMASIELQWRLAVSTIDPHDLELES